MNAQHYEQLIFDIGAAQDVLAEVVGNSPEWAHEFLSDPIKVISRLRPHYYENYCRCGYRAHAEHIQDLAAEQGRHLNEVSTIVAESRR